MYAKDHLPPHFHARYSEFVTLIDIRTGELLEGELARRALRLIQDWAELHRTELLENWNEGQSDNPDFRKIEPLK